MGVAYWARRSSQIVKHLEFDSLWSRLAQAGYGVWLYLVKMVAPLRDSALLSPARGGAFPGANLRGRGDWTGPRQRGGRRPAEEGTMAARSLGSLSPDAGAHLGLIRVGHTIAADRYSYLASILWVIPLAGGLTLLGRSLGPMRVRLATVAAGLALVVGMAFLSRSLARTWHDSESLWLRALICAPRARRRMSTMRRRWARGAYATAVSEFDKALAIWPDDPDSLVKRGSALSGQGKYEEAISSYRAALVLRPDDAMAYLNLGGALAARGQYDEAIAMYRKALIIQPGRAGIGQPWRCLAPAG